MERFKALSHKARIANEATQKDKKYTRTQSAPAAPSVERFSQATSSIEKRLDDIECSIKKLELNLILVDGEGEDYTEYSNLKNKLKGICKQDTTLNEFLSNMDNKRNSNRLKKLINWLSLICPLITLFNQTSLPQIISAKFTNKDLGIADTTFQKYAIKAGKIFTDFLNGIEKHKDTVEIMDKVYEVEFVPAIANTVFANITRAPGTIVTQMPSIIRRVHTLSKPLLIEVISEGKHYTSKLCKSYNIIIKTFYLAMFMYILFYSKFRLRANNTHHNITDILNMTSFIKNSGGKKSKKSKKSKKMD